MVGIPTITLSFNLEIIAMKNAVIKEYDAPVDNKKRVTIRGASFTHYRIEEYSDGTIFLRPRVLVDPNLLSRNTLRMLDKSVANLKKGRVSKPINLDKYAGRAKNNGV
jgi:hypothetical protein